MALIKIMPRKSPSAIASTLKYIQDSSKTKDGKVYQILHNVRSSDLDGQIREYYTNESHRKVRRSNTTYVRHELLSFSPESRPYLSNEILEDITREYIRLRGSNALVVASIHNQGTEAYHVHLAVSGTELISGKSTDVPKKKLASIKQSLQSFYLQRYPELGQSAVRHGLGREYISSPEYRLKLRTNRGLKKEEIARTVRSCFEQSKTQNEFLDRLREAGLPHYERKEGIAQGVICGDRKFRFSRMEVPIMDLPFDRTPDEQALEEIRKIRSTLSDQDKELNR